MLAQVTYIRSKLYVFNRMRSRRRKPSRRERMLPTKTDECFQPCYLLIFAINLLVFASLFQLEVPLPNFFDLACATSIFSLVATVGSAAVQMSRSMRKFDDLSIVIVLKADWDNILYALQKSHWIGKDTSNRHVHRTHRLSTLVMRILSYFVCS